MDKDMTFLLCHYNLNIILIGPHICLEPFGLKVFQQYGEWTSLAIYALVNLSVWVFFCEIGVHCKPATIAVRICQYLAFHLPLYVGFPPIPLCWLSTYPSMLAFHLSLYVGFPATPLNQLLSSFVQLSLPLFGRWHNLWTVHIYHGEQIKMNVIRFC